MPIYEYQCRTCGKRTELLQRMDDPPMAACPECGGPVKKLISSPAVQFKGSGWYVTDYGGKKGGGKGEGGAKGEGGGESKAAEKSSSSPSSESSGSTTSTSTSETKAAKASE